MAEIHAITDGNWNTASIWDSNSIPTSADIVYIDNHIITWSGNIAECKELHFSGTGYISGSFQCNGNVTLDLGLSSQNSAFRNGAIINGNVILYSGVLFNNNGGNIVGNLYTYNHSKVIGFQAGGSYGNFSIVGNTYVYDSSLLRELGASVRNLTYNGEIIIDSAYYGSTPPFNWQTSQSWDLFITKVSNYSNVPFMNNFGAPSKNTSTQLAVIDIGELYSPNANLISEGLPVDKTLNISKATIKNISLGTIYNWVIGDLTITTQGNILFDNWQINNIHSNPDAHLHIYTSEQTTDLQPQESNVKDGVIYDGGNRTGTYTPNFPQEANVLKDVEYGDNQKGTLEVISLSGATATADNISVVNLTEQEVNRVKNCATVSTVQKCFEDFKEE